ncbi:MAG: metallophosphoesterase family protein [Actinomycetota bacterium]|nr:metallophosphoesterase family protein [Actinomycetota bacterium]
MRYGVISDIHANLHALDSALAFLATQGVDGYLCAGDLVGYGPLPNETVRRVLGLPGRCVAGNHELIVLGRLTDERCTPLAQASLRWTRKVLDDEARALLSQLPLDARVQNIALHHGSIGDPQEYVLRDAQALACIQELERAEPGADILILGHTHRPMAVGARRGSLLRGSTGAVSLPQGESIVLNPGAVGQSRSADARARVMVLDLAARVATFHALPYDVAACRQALRERGLPPASCHVPRSRWADVADVVKRRVRRVI